MVLVDCVTFISLFKIKVHKDDLSVSLRVALLWSDFNSIYASYYSANTVNNGDSTMDLEHFFVSSSYGGEGMNR